MFNNPLHGRFLEQLAPALKCHLAERLPEAAVPGQFMVLERLPLTPSGKLDRRGLPDPDHQRRGGKPLIRPRTQSERELVSLWEELLNVSGVGVEDDFFRDLGGHSLLATQLVSRIRTRLGFELSLRDVFEHPTVRALGTFLQTRTAVSEKTGHALKPVSRSSYRADSVPP
jgi:acyl carrier protein